MMFTLPEDAETFLRTFSSFVAPRELYLVGGAVRDRLLGGRVQEFDLAVSDDLRGVLSGERWSEFFPALPTPRKPVFFKKYLTGKLFFDGELLPGIASLDLSQLRSEHYEFPGAYPVVLPGNIESDQRRRDFSVNALAVRIPPVGAIELIDRVGGMPDLSERILRFLHPQSFIDDPARMIRGCRFAARLGFLWEEKTREGIENAVRSDAIGTVPSRRLFDEVKKALLESESEKVLSQLDEFGLFPQIFGTQACLSRYRSDTRWGAQLASLYPSEEALRESLDRFQVNGRERTEVFGA